MARPGSGFLAKPQNRRKRTSPEPPALAQGAFARGCEDAKAQCLTLRFVVAEVAVTTTVGALVTWWVGLLAFFALIGLVFVISILLAPLLQRNDSRRALERLLHTEYDEKVRVTQLVSRCQRLSGEIEYWLRNRTRHYQSPRSRPFSTSPVAEARRNLLATRRDRETMDWYESEFAGRVYALVAHLKERDYIGEELAYTLNNPEHVSDLGAIAAKLKGIGVRLDGLREPQP